MPELAEGQVSIRGLVMGPGTPYIVQSFAPEDLQTRGEQTARAWAHGAWAGAEFAEPRTVAATVVVSAWSAADWDDLHADLKAAFAPVATGPDVELRWAIGGRQYVLFGRPRSAATNTAGVHQGTSPVVCGFMALDPLKYAADIDITDPVEAPAFTGGLRLPVRLPFSIGAAATSGQVEITNAGTAAVGIRFSITGPGKRPKVIVTPADPELPVATWSYLGDIAEHRTLVVDTAARTVFDGAASRRSLATGDWPQLPPGGSALVRLRGWDIRGARLVVESRSAWW